MQISSFNPSFNKSTQISQNKPLIQNLSNQNLQSVETAGTVGMSPAEVLGRYQVNFSGKSDENFKLSEADTNFAKGFGEVFRLDKKDSQKAEQIIKDFLKENGFKELSDMESDDPFEFANESACLTEQLSETFKLTDFESTALTGMVVTQINCGDISKVRNCCGENLIEENKYVRDYTPLKHLAKKYGIQEPKTFNSLFDYLRNFTDVVECESLFDLFKKENLYWGEIAAAGLQNPKRGGLTSTQTTNFMLDMINLSGKSLEERLEGINRRESREIFEDGMDTLTLACKIADKFDIEISERLLEMLEARKTEKEVHKNGQSIVEVAYRISEEFHLPANSTKEIVKIIEEHNAKNYPDKINDLIGALTKND